MQEPARQAKPLDYRSPSEDAKSLRRPLRVKSAAVTAAVLLGMMAFQRIRTPAPQVPSRPFIMTMPLAPTTQPAYLFVPSAPQSAYPSPPAGTVGIATRPATAPSPRE